LDFNTSTEAACRERVEIKITENGICHGWLGWFQTRVGEQWLSTSPFQKKMHWRQVFMPLRKPVQVKKGDLIEFELNRPEFGEWTWITGFADTQQKQSTFYTNLEVPVEFSKYSDTNKPVLTE